MKQSTLLNQGKRRLGGAHYQLRQTSSSTSGVRAGRTEHIALKLEKIFFVDRSLPKEYIHPFCLIMVLFAELLHTIRYPWPYQISNAIAPVRPNPLRVSTVKRQLFWRAILEKRGPTPKYKHLPPPVIFNFADPEHISNVKGRS